MTNTPPKVLIAEDNPGLARVLTFKIKSGGYHPLTCRDGREAWNTFEANRGLVAIISDHEMPYLSGLELFARVREVDAKMPLMLVTGRQLELSQTAVKEELKITQIFGKPFSPGELLAALDQTFAQTHEDGPQGADVVELPCPSSNSHEAVAK